MNKNILSVRKILEKAENVTDPHAIKVFVTVVRILLEECLKDDLLSSLDKNLILRLKKSSTRILFNKLEQLNAVDFESLRVRILLIVSEFHTETKENMQNPVYEAKYKQFHKMSSEEISALGLAAEPLKRRSIKQSSLSL